MIFGNIRLFRLPLLFHFVRLFLQALLTRRKSVVKVFRGLLLRAWQLTLLLILLLLFFALLIGGCRVWSLLLLLVTLPRPRRGWRIFGNPRLLFGIPSALVLVRRRRWHSVLLRPGKPFTGRLHKPYRLRCRCRLITSFRREVRNKLPFAKRGSNLRNHINKFVVALLKNIVKYPGIFPLAFQKITGRLMLVIVPWHVLLVVKISRRRFHRRKSRRNMVVRHFPNRVPRRRIWGTCSSRVVKLKRIRYDRVLTLLLLIVVHPRRRINKLVECSVIRAFARDEGTRTNLSSYRVVTKLSRGTIPTMRQKLLLRVRRTVWKRVLRR